MLQVIEGQLSIPLLKRPVLALPCGAGALGPRAAAPGSGATAPGLHSTQSSSCPLQLHRAVAPPLPPAARGARCRGGRGRASRRARLSRLSWAAGRVEFGAPPAGRWRAAVVKRRCGCHAARPARPAGGASLPARGQGRSPRKAAPGHQKEPTRQGQARGWGGQQWGPHENCGVASRGCHHATVNKTP